MFLGRLVFCLDCHYSHPGRHPDGPRSHLTPRPHCYLLSPRPCVNRCFGGVTVWAIPGILLAWRAKSPQSIRLPSYNCCGPFIIPSVGNPRPGGVQRWRLVSQSGLPLAKSRYAIKTSLIAVHGMTTGSHSRSRGCSRSGDSLADVRRDGPNVAVGGADPRQSAADDGLSSSVR